jgi:hypothetical protein
VRPQGIGPARLGGAVLNGVVPKRRNCLILVAAVLQHEGGDGEQMGDVGDRGLFAELPPVKSLDFTQGLIESVGYHKFLSSVGHVAGIRIGVPVAPPGTVARRSALYPRNTCHSFTKARVSKQQ